MNYLKVENISFAYQKNNLIFKDVSLEIKSKEFDGHIAAIMGSSGCGKSTLFKLILDIEKNYSGQITTFPNQPIISYVPQETVLFEHLSPLQNARYFEKISNYKSKFNNDLFNQVCSILELNDILKNVKTVLEMSGGQRQRLSLLRALSINPDFLLLDEPCNGLDAEVKETFLHKLREITVEYGLFVLYITHHKIEAQLIADEVIYMIKDNKNNFVNKIVQGNIQEFISKPPAIEAAKVFNFPELNILCVKVNENGDIQLVNNKLEIKDEKTFYLALNLNTIQLSDESGFLFEIIAKSPMYALIKNKEHGIVLTLKTNQLNNRNISDNVFILIKGKALKYDINGFLTETIILDNNKIISSY